MPVFTSKSKAILFWSSAQDSVPRLGRAHRGRGPRAGARPSRPRDRAWHHLVSTKKWEIGVKESWVQSSALEEAAASK